MFIATINEYKGKNAKEDRSGNLPLILNVLGGKCPNKRLISLGWAETQGMEVGKTYLMEAIELEPHELHGRQFQFNKVGDALSALEIAIFAEEKPRKVYNVSASNIEVSEAAFQTVSAKA